MRWHIDDCGGLLRLPLTELEQRYAKAVADVVGGDCCYDVACIALMELRLKVPREHSVIPSLVKCMISRYLRGEPCGNWDYRELARELDELIDSAMRTRDFLKTFLRL